MPRDISIVMPAREEHPQATFTLQAIWDQLEDSPFDWETIIVDNLSTDKTSQFCKGRWWERYAKRHHIIKYDEEGSCWQARNAGIKAAEGRVIFLFDAHVLVSPDYFVKHISALDANPSATILYGPVVSMGDTRDHRAYGYSFGPEDDPLRTIRTKFWGSWTRKKFSDAPYRVPMSGTAAMTVRREFLEKLGGWPNELSVYGGGEQWIALACWMLGYECWVHPDTYVYHYADYRKYKDNGSDKSTQDAHHFNVCLVAYALGGEEWWQARVDHMLEQWKPPYHEGGMRLAREAKEKARMYRERIKQLAECSLEEMLERRPWEAVCATL